MELQEVREMAFEEMWLHGLEDSIFRLNDLTRDFEADDLAACQRSDHLGNCIVYRPYPDPKAIIELDEQFVLLNNRLCVRDVL